MPITKTPGGVEDLTFGVGTEQQQRKGAIHTLTQINASYIPYSSTQSITAKIDQEVSKTDATRIDLNNHKNNKDNPHEVTPEDVGASPMIHTHEISDVNNLSETLDTKANTVDLDTKADVGDSYLKTEHIQQSAGSADAGKPIILGGDGRLDPTIAGQGLTFIAMFTPTAGAEYPDNTGYQVGAYWGIEGVGSYTFVGGDLAGTTLDDGDALVNGQDAWGYVLTSIDPSDFYRLDGTVAIMADFAGGGKKITNIIDGVAVTDGATVGQMNTALALKADVGDSYEKSEHIQQSAGSADAGKPIVLASDGRLDPTIAGQGLTFIAMFTPTAGAEYPDNVGYQVGSYWGIEGVGSYTFVGGDLAGTTKGSRM